MTKRLLLILSFLFKLQLAFSQISPITENTKVSVLTVDVADEAHSLYGHTAIRIKDTSSGIDLVYNYGMFDFATENFILKFIKGDLEYYAAAYSYDDFDYSYKIDNRSIYEQVLTISLDEKRKLYEKLNQSINSEDRYYTYKFIDKNCTTKVIDVLNEVLENKPIIKKNIDSKSHRDVLYPYSDGHFYQKLGINIIFGTKVDLQETTIFLPMDLFDNLKQTKYEGKPLISQTETLFKAKRKPLGFSFFDSIYSLIVILLLLVIPNKKITNIIYLVIIGTIGILFSIVTFYSFHKEVYWNYNILLFNPLFIILAFLIGVNNQKWVKKISLFSLVILGFYTLYIVNKIHFMVVLPIIISTGIILLRITTKKLLPTIK